MEPLRSRTLPSPSTTPSPFGQRLCQPPGGGRKLFAMAPRPGWRRPVRQQHPPEAAVQAVAHVVLVLVDEQRHLVDEPVVGRDGAADVAEHARLDEQLRMGFTNNSSGSRHAPILLPMEKHATSGAALL